MNGTVLSLIALALLLPQEKKNEAEELFKGLEERLSKASTLHVEFTSTFEQGEEGGEKAKGSLSGAVRMKEGNLARLEYTGKIVEPMKCLIISDGKAMALAHEDPAIYPPSKTSETLKRDAILGMTRMGGTGTVLEWQKHLMLQAGERRMAESGRKAEPRETDPRKTLKLGAFKLGEGTKVDGRDAVILRFEVEEVGKPGKAHVILSLDASTRLPLRRRIVDEDKGIVIEEVYKTFKIDEKIDLATFELPK